MRSVSRPSNSACGAGRADDSVYQTVHRCPWCPRGADFSLHTEVRRMNEHIKRCHEDKMCISRDDFDALERVVATKSGIHKSYVEFRGAHVGVLTQLAFGFSPKFVKSERCDPQNHERRMSTDVFYISSDSDSEEQPADYAPGADGDQYETDRNNRELLQNRYFDETSEQPNISGACIAVSPARVIEGDSQARCNGEVLANGEEADCISNRCVDAVDGKIKVEHARDFCPLSCSRADSLCQAMQHEAQHEPLHVATDGNCDISSAVGDTFDRRDHSGEPYDGRNDCVDIDIDDGTDSPENRLAVDAMSGAFTALTGANVEPQAPGAITSDPITNTSQSSVVDECSATDNFTAVCCAAAVSAVIAATNNISDDAVSRCAFFESFSLFMSSAACDAFKQSQGLCPLYIREVLCKRGMTLRDVLERICRKEIHTLHEIIHGIEQVWSLPIYLLPADHQHHIDALACRTQWREHVLPEMARSRGAVVEDYLTVAQNSDLDHLAAAASFVSQSIAMSTSFVPSEAVKDAAPVDSSSKEIDDAVLEFVRIHEFPSDRSIPLQDAETCRPFNWIDSMLRNKDRCTTAAAIKRAVIKYNSKLRNTGLKLKPLTDEDLDHCVEKFVRIYEFPANTAIPTRDEGLKRKKMLQPLRCIHKIVMDDGFELCDGVIGQPDRIVDAIRRYNSKIEIPLQKGLVDHNNDVTDQENGQQIANLAETASSCVSHGTGFDEVNSANLTVETAPNELPTEPGHLSAIDSAEIRPPTLQELYILSCHFSCANESVSVEDVRALISAGMPYGSISAAKEWCVHNLLKEGLLKSHALARDWIVKSPFQNLSSTSPNAADRQCSAHNSSSPSLQPQKAMSDGVLSHTTPETINDFHHPVSKQLPSSSTDPSQNSKEDTCPVQRDTGLQVDNISEGPCRKPVKCSVCNCYGHRASNKSFHPDTASSLSPMRLSTAHEHDSSRRLISCHEIHQGVHAEFERIAGNTIIAGTLCAQTSRWRCLQPSVEACTHPIAEGSLRFHARRYHSGAPAVVVAADHSPQPAAAAGEVSNSDAQNLDPAKPSQLQDFCSFSGQQEGDGSVFEGNDAGLPIQPENSSLVMTAISSPLESLATDGKLQEASAYSENSAELEESETCDAPDSLAFRQLNHGQTLCSSTASPHMLSFDLFQMVDAKDCCGVWYQAAIVKKFEKISSTFVRVHFIGFGRECDENLGPSRLRSFSLETDIGPGGPESLEDIRRTYALTPLPAPIQEHFSAPLVHEQLRAFTRCDALDCDGIWYDAVIIKGSTLDSTMRIHFNGWPKSQSKTIRRKDFSTRVRPHTGGCCIGPKGHETMEMIAAMHGYSLDVFDEKSPYFRRSSSAAGSSEMNSSFDADPSSPPEDCGVHTTPKLYVPDFDRCGSDGYGEEISSNIRSWNNTVCKKRAISDSDMNSDGFAEDYAIKRVAYENSDQDNMMARTFFRDGTAGNSSGINQNIASERTSRIITLSDSDRRIIFSQMSQAIQTSLDKINELAPFALTLEVLTDDPDALFRPHHSTASPFHASVCDSSSSIFASYCISLAASNAARFSFGFGAISTTLLCSPGEAALFRGAQGCVRLLKNVTALHLAALHGADQVVCMLMKQGEFLGLDLCAVCVASVGKKQFKMTALDVAAAAGHVSTIQMLLTCFPYLPSDPVTSSCSDDASANSTSASSRAYAHFVAASCDGITSEDSYGRWSPLQFCTVQRHPIATKLLLLHGADPTVCLGTALKTVLEVAFKAFKDAIILQSQQTASCAEPSLSPLALACANQTESSAKVLAAIFQEGCGEGFRAIEPPQQHMYYGSDFSFCVLSAVWARDLPLIEAFLRLVKVELNACDEFCGSLASSSNVSVPVSAAAVSSAPSISIGAACLHASVELGYYEGALAFLNFGVPVDILFGVAPVQDNDDVEGRQLLTALQKVVGINAPQTTVLNIAGLLISQGADVAFLKDASLSPSEARQCASINNFIRQYTSNGTFRPPFVCTSTTISTRDSITKTKSVLGHKHLACQCRSGLCQLSRTTSSSSPCPCLTQFREAAHRIDVPPFWNNSHMSMSGIESCIRGLGLCNSGTQADEDCLGAAGIVHAADAMCTDIEPLVAMKSGWSILASDAYTKHICSGAGATDDLILAGLVSMIDGLARFMDGAKYGTRHGVMIGRAMRTAIKKEIVQQENVNGRNTIPATLAWFLIQFEEDFFNGVSRKILPEYCLHKLRLYFSFERPLWRSKMLMIVNTVMLSKSLDMKATCRDIGECVGALQQAVAVVLAADVISANGGGTGGAANGGGTGGAAVSCKQWQVKILPSCSSLCLSNLFGNLSIKDQFPLEIKGWSRDCGAGIFATCDIPQGAAVCPYIGELVSDQDMTVRECRNSQRDHTLELEPYYKCWSHLKIRGRYSLIDADRCGSIGRYANHGCGDSVNLQRCILEQHSQVALLVFVASRDISAGDELRWDYFSGKEGKDRKKLMWWGACSCPDCPTPDQSGAAESARRRKRVYDSD